MGKQVTSSFCSGAECVAVERVSSFCHSGGCVGVTAAADEIVVRDTKQGPDAPGLRFTLDEWHAFVAGVKAGEFDVEALAAPGVLLTGGALAS